MAAPLSFFPAAAACISIEETGVGASAVAAAAREMEICKKWDNRKIVGGPALLVGFMSQLPFLVLCLKDN